MVLKRKRAASEEKKSCNLSGGEEQRTKIQKRHSLTFSEVRIFFLNDAISVCMDYFLSHPLSFWKCFSAFSSLQFLAATSGAFGVPIQNRERTIRLVWFLFFILSLWDSKKKCAIGLNAVTHARTKRTNVNRLLW